MNAPLDVPFSARGPLQWAPAAVVIALGLAAALVSLLLLRRLLGSLTTPLDAAGLLATGVALATAAAGLRLAWRRLLGSATRRQFRRLDFVVRWFPAACLAVAIAAIWLPGTSRWGMLGLIAVVYLEEAWSCRGRRWRGAGDRRVSRARAPQVDPPPSPSPAAALRGAHAMAGEVQQQFVRSRASDGTEVVAGCVRVPFDARQRTANAHVAFCPPLEKSPQIEFHQLDGPAARIKLGQSLPYGARLELKLAAPAEERVDVLVEFEARVGGADAQ